MLVRGPMSLMSPCVCPQVDERLALDLDARGSGVVINTCGWVEDMGYELILHAAAKLKVDLIVVLGQDRLYQQLEADMAKEGWQTANDAAGETKDGDGGSSSCGSSSKVVSVVKLSRSEGANTRNTGYRKEARTARIRQYLYGPVQGEELLPR